MDTNHWRPPQVGEPSMDAGDWKTQLQQDSRERIVNKIMDTLKRHLPFSAQEGLQELKKIFVRFEEKMYTAATSQVLPLFFCPNFLCYTHLLRELHMYQICNFLTTHCWYLYSICISDSNIVSLEWLSFSF